MHDRAVHAEAVFALAPGVTVQTGYLRDAAGREYPVDGYGELVARSCSEPVCASDLARAMSHLSGASIEQVQATLSPFVGRLNALRLLSVHQSFAREWGRNVTMWPFDVIVMMATRSLPPARFASRRIYAPTVANVARAVAESYTFLTAFAVVVVLVTVVMTNLVTPLTPVFTADRSALIALVATAAAALLLFAAFAHEMGHLTVARLCGVRVIGVQARRAAASVVLAPRSDVRVRAAILAGPLAGATFACACGALLLGFLQPGWQLAAIDNVRVSVGFIGLLIAACQLLSLLPLFGDGRALRAARVGRR